MARARTKQWRLTSARGPPLRTLGGGSTIYILVAREGDPIRKLGKTHCRAIQTRSMERVVASGIVLSQEERCLFVVRDVALIPVQKKCFSANYGFLGRFVGCVLDITQSFF